MPAVAAVVDALRARLPVVVPTLVAIVAVLLLQYVLNWSSLSRIPVVGQELGSDDKRRQTYLYNARSLYLEGYKKFKDRVYRIVTPNKFTVIVIPTKFLEELRKLPDDVVSFSGAVEQTMHAKYTEILVEAPLIIHTVKSNLTPSLVRLNPSIYEEVIHAIREVMPPCDGWTSVNINRSLLRIVALVSGRVFIGTELSRSPEYLDAAINYTVELMEARRALERTRAWMRPFVGHRLPEVKKLKERVAQAIRFLQPVVEARLKLSEEEKPNDMLRWIMDNQAKVKHYSTEELARLQLGLSFAAIHTTTLTATNVFYNIAAYPQYTDELRNEIRTVLAEHDGVFSTTALQAMKKLDSFIKETMRINPPGFNSFTRKVNKPFTLSNGEVIPAGVVIEVPAVAVTRDPEVFENPDVFDPWRFYRLREEARARGEVEAAAQNQFVSVNPGVMTFGWGRHACPGRFFAANEIKMIVATYILTYDIRLPDGVTERYPNLSFGSSSIPDPSKEILFKLI